MLSAGLVHQTDRPLWIAGFSRDPLCSLWFKPLGFSPNTSTHADRGAALFDTVTK